MGRTKLILLRFLILLIALALPLAAVVLWAGKPAKYDIATLDGWAPIKDPGPSTKALATGVTKLAGPARTQPPEWFTAEDQDLLAKAVAALRADKLQAGLGHLMVLSSHMDERGKTLKDFLPLVAPDITAWLVATYFAPLLLGTLLVVFVFLIFMPWLVRRLLDAFKVLIGILVCAAAIAGAIAICLSLSSQHALVFTLIEYLVVVVTLTVLGNLILLWRLRRTPKPLPAPARDYPQTPLPRRERAPALPPQPAVAPAYRPNERPPAPPPEPVAVAPPAPAPARVAAEDETLVGGRPGGFAVRDRDLS